MTKVNTTVAITIKNVEEISIVPNGVLILLPSGHILFIPNDKNITITAKGDNIDGTV